jgi:hypothetical protein
VNFGEKTLYSYILLGAIFSGWISLSSWTSQCPLQDGLEMFGISSLYRQNMSNVAMNNVKDLGEKFSSKWHV